MEAAVNDFIAGAVAGAFAITLSQPLDTVRVRLQQGGAGDTSATRVLLGMLRKEGVWSPWKGLTYPLLFASVQSAILFQAYGWTLRQLATQQPAADRQLPQHPTTSTSTTSTTSTSAPAASVPAHTLHTLHLHHHHHAQDTASLDVHGPYSITAHVVGWAAAALGQPYGRGGNSNGSSGGSSSGGGGGAGAPAAAAAAGAAADAWEAAGPRGTAAAAPTAVAKAGTSRSYADASRNTSGGSASSSSSSGSGSSSSSGSSRSSGGGHGGAGVPAPWHGFVAGSVSGAAQVVLWSPVELLKLRSQLQTAAPGTPGYRNPAALGAGVLRSEGVAGLYRGFTLTVVRDVPSYALYFFLYHDIAAALSPGIPPEQAPPSTQVVAGGLAGVLAWLPIYPLDVIKSRVQAVGASASKGKGWLHYAREMHCEGGAAAFLRGIGPTLARAFLMDAASFLGYSSTLRFLGGSSEPSPAAAGAEGGSSGSGGGGSSSSGGGGSGGVARTAHAAVQAATAAAAGGGGMAA